MNQKQFAELLDGFKGLLLRTCQPIADRVKAIEEWKAGIPADLKGERGADGLPGKDGVDGADGKDGRDGLDGKDGAPGPAGERGEPGQKGDPGADGAAGRDGKDADPEVMVKMVADAVAVALPAAVEKALEARLADMVAKAAELVPRPKDGADGAAGRDGRDGLDGKSVDPAEVEAIVAKHVAAIPAPKDGINGKDGRDGVDGKGVDVAEVMELVVKAVEALPKPADGKDGRDGINGKDGEHGRDAVQIDTLAGIEPLRRYQRGTYAMFRGGEVKAFRQTDLMPADAEDIEKFGWSVVRNGVNEFAVESADDGRTVAIAAKMTDGRVVMKTVDFPVVIDRGIFKSGDIYKQGDGVTWDGSFWIAQRSTDAGEKPGDASGAFRLAVKKGRDGRDGLKGEKGDRGAEGRDGKDLTHYNPQTGDKW